MQPKIQVACGACGSTDVLLDAWARWDEERQAWKLHDTLTHGFCRACDGECHLVERGLALAPA